ncbi:hypothetical protein P7C73_g4946, partial [Tremellales sp. Uapishka_1]
MAGISMATEMEASSSVVPKSKEKKEKKEKKSKKEVIDIEGNVEAPSSSVALEEVKETKEERRARKEAKKAAKAASAAARTGEVPPQPEEASVAPVEPMASASTSGQPAEGETPVKKSKKSKKRDREDRPLEPPSDMLVKAPEVEVEAEVEPEVAVEASQKEKKRKRQEEGSVEVSSGPVVPEEKKLKKLKKAKRIVPPEEQEQDEAEKAKDVGAGPEKVEGIFGDAELSDQAKKGIHYAHLYALSQADPPPEPKVWKFSKPKQGWLMRNIWNDVEIPEKYTELVMAYLKTIQGGGRAALIETAREYSTAEAVPESNPATAAVSAAEVAPEASTKPEETQEAVEKAKGTEVEVKNDNVVEEQRKREVRKSRGERLLALLEPSQSL